MESHLQFEYLEETSKRKSFRASFAGLRVIILGESFDVYDLSTSGICFINTEGINLLQNQKYFAHVTIGSRLYIADLPFQILRFEQDLRVGCCFVDLSPRQKIRLDKLILEMQKRSITHTK